MTRLYYACPIEAAHMAKRFGMRFVSWHSGKEYEPCVILTNAGSPIKSVREGQRYVVHAESLHLLEPNDKDLYVNTAGMPEFWYSRIGLTWHKRYRIIQRDGEAFHWPLRETVGPVGRS